MIVRSAVFKTFSQVGKYFVKWVGWSSDTNTWEPEANLECTDLLVEFYKTRVSSKWYTILY